MGPKKNTNKKGKKDAPDVVKGEVDNTKIVKVVEKKAKPSKKKVEEDYEIESISVKKESKVDEAVPKKRGRPKKDKESKLIETKEEEIPKEKYEEKSKSPIKKNDSEKKEKSGYYLMSKNTKLFNDDCIDFLSGSCNNNYCKYIHNYSKLQKEKNNLEFNKRYLNLYQDFQVLIPFEKKIMGKASLDVMFIMDCTGSMASWIVKCKEELGNIITFIQESNPHSPINMSFIGYRDHGDKDSLVYHPFTQNIPDLKKFISNITAYGGGDTPEDLTGGLNLALKQDWKSKAKYAIIVTDAPCHGKDYHDCHDNYPNGCPNKFSPEKLIEEFAEKDIILSAVSITNITDKMYDILNKAYSKIAKRNINIAKLGNSTSQFGFVVAFGASSTLSSVTIGNVSIREFLNMIKKETIIANIEEEKGILHTEEEREKLNINNIDESIIQNKPVNKNLHEFLTRINTLMGQADLYDDPQPDLIEGDSKYKTESKNFFTFNDLKYLENENNSIFKLKHELDLNYKIIVKPVPNDWDEISSNTFSAICHSFTIPKNRNNSYVDWKNPLIKHNFIQTEVVIDDTPFAEGAMRYAFYMKDLMLDQNLVGKLDKKIKLKEQSLAHYSKDILSIVICRHIAYDFNDRVINIVPDTRLLINFVHSYIYEMISYINKKETLQSHQQYFSVENFIKGNYSKYNNNAGWINDNLNESAVIAQAFSHFSWQITKGYLMIVDLQGVDNILTDPQIHCLDNKKFGKGNLGYVGIMKFFMTHICNSYCKELGLIHPRKYVEINNKFEFFVDQFLPPIEPEKLIYKLCDVCKEVFKAKAKDLFDKKKKCWDSFCESCDMKRKDTFTFAKCKKCGSGFKSSAFLFMMRREPFPKSCQKCKIDEGILERKDFDMCNEEE